MQINATVIAAQEAARQARAALLTPKPQPADSFLSELNTSTAPGPAAQKAPAAPAAAMPQTPTRPGSLVDIKI